MPSKTRQSSQERLSYLERLHFDPRLAGSLVAKYLTNIRLVMLLILTIVLLGSVAYLDLPKRLNPEVKIPIVTVVTVLPGAGPEDVEKLVTIPLEDELQGLSGIDVLNSTSQSNVSFITIQFFSSVDGEKAKNDAQSAVDTVSDLPENAQTPKVAVLDFEDQPIWQFVLTTQKGYPDLMNFADRLQQEIDALPKVDRVVTTGFDTHEIVVEVNPDQLATYKLNPFELSQAIKKARSSYPAGTVTSDQNTFSLTIDPQLETIDDIRNLKLQIDNRTVSLSDIATVAQRSKPDQQQTVIIKPGETTTPAVTFYVYKTSDSNIDDAGKSVKEKVDGLLAEQNNGYQITTIINTSDEINKQFSDLLQEFRSTILLVFTCLLLFLGLRQALISSLTVPLTFFSAFVIMRLTGMSINFLSLFAFLLALGLIVDDTIVVVSAMTTYFKTGRFTPLEAGLLVWKDTITPIWSTTITTIWSFVPLLITSGIIGEFIKPIPIVVTATMLSSTAIAVLVTLPIMIILLKPRIPGRVISLLRWTLIITAIVIGGMLLKSNPLFPLLIGVYLLLMIVIGVVWPFMKARITKSIKNSRLIQLINRYSHHGIINVEPLAAWYKRSIEKILAKKSSRRQVMIGIVVYAIFSFALLPLGFVKTEFFPKSNQNQLYITLELPAGTLLQQTAVESQNIIQLLSQTPENEFVIAEIGKSGSQGQTESSANQAFFTIRLQDAEERTKSSLEIAEKLRDQFRDYTQGDISVIEESGGPPAGSDLQIKLLGPDLQLLSQQADQITGYLDQQSGVTNVQKSIKEGTSKITFEPDAAKLSANGLSLDTVGFSLRLFASGFTLDSLAFDDGSTEKTDVTMRLQPGLGKPETLSSLSVTNTQGAVIPLMSLGQLALKSNPTQITRENGQRTIDVTAAVTPGYNTADKNKDLENFASSLKLPPGYEWKTGGVNEENNKSVQSILMAMILSAVLILITMVVQFNSFRQAMIVLIVIPFAVSSVFLAFSLTGTPLSFPALIGVLSLFGIVVTNSMFIVDKINLNRKENMPFNEAIADAGASRLEPIILTKLSTVFGLLPITIADPLWRGLGGAIISGLLIASTIMLLFIPVLYFEWMKTDTTD